MAKDSSVSVLDLVTGETTAVEGFTLAQWDTPTFIANPSGTKVLFASYGGQADGLGISSLGGDGPGTGRLHPAGSGQRRQPL